MERLLSFGPILKNLSEHLDDYDLKSLSEVSKEFWKATEEIISDRFQFKPKGFCNFLRNYKHVTITADESLFPKISKDVESLCFENFMYERKQPDLSFLYKLEKLEKLVFSHTYIPEDCGCIRGLKYFHASVYYGDVEAFKEIIRGNPEIETLNINFQQRTYDYEPYNNILKVIHVPKLKYFRYFSLSITCNDGLSEFFRNHPNLEKCTILGPRVTDDVLTALCESSSNLESFELNLCKKLTSSIFDDLKSLNNLKHLKMNAMYASFENVTKMNLENLRSFRYSSCWFEEQMNPEQIVNILPSSRHLKFLDLTNIQRCKKYPLSPYLLMKLLSKKYPNLRELHLDWIFDENDDSGNYDEIIEFLEMEQLDLSRTLLSDSFLAFIRLPKLTTILMEESKITIKGIDHLLENSPFVKEIHLSTSPELQFETVEYLIENSKFLRRLEIFECPQFSESREYFEKINSKRKLLHYNF